MQLLPILHDVDWMFLCQNRRRMGSDGCTDLVRTHIHPNMWNIDHVCCRFDGYKAVVAADIGSYVGLYLFLPVDSCAAESC